MLAPSSFHLTLPFGPPLCLSSLGTQGSTPTVEAPSLVEQSHLHSVMSRHSKSRLTRAYSIIERTFSAHGQGQGQGQEGHTQSQHRPSVMVGGPHPRPLSLGNSGPLQLPRPPPLPQRALGTRLTRSASVDAVPFDGARGGMDGPSILWPSILWPSTVAEDLLGAGQSEDPVGAPLSLHVPRAKRRVSFTQESPPRAGGASTASLSGDGSTSDPRAGGARGVSASGGPSTSDSPPAGPVVV